MDRSLAACELLYNAGYRSLFWVQGGLESAEEEVFVFSELSLDFPFQVMIIILCFTLWLIITQLNMKQSDNNVILTLYGAGSNQRRPPAF